MQNVEYISFGETLPDIDAELLTHDASKKLLAACLTTNGFKVLELRSFKNNNNSISDIIVVDCGDGSVTSRNRAGIKVRERLALLYQPNKPTEYPYDVRALRKEFPTTMHQNHVAESEPTSLCLYIEPWSSLERTWTPKKHLSRILWWLREASQETLHREDQPLEQLYFASPWKIVLPSNFHEQIQAPENLLQLALSTNKEDTQQIYVGQFTNKNEKISIGANCIAIKTAPIQHGAIEAFPYTLGELDQQLKNRGSGILEELINVIKDKTPSQGIEILSQDSNPTFIFISIPLKRHKDLEPEKNHIICYWLESSLAEIGIATGALIKQPDKSIAFVSHSIGSYTDQIDNWKPLKIHPLEAKLKISSDYAAIASGILDKTQFKGIIAGVGALGSTLAEIWSRECWGEWAYVDDDIFDVHNVVRHIGKDYQIGQPKVNVVKETTDLNYSNQNERSQIINSKINDFKNPKIINLLNSSDLLIDATTTLEAPRDLSYANNTPRIASTFITPSGLGSVLLMEDKKKSISISSIEAQYYRSILKYEWGDQHLKKYSNDLWVGAGCRDTSVIMSYELIQLHSAILARQIRKLSVAENASINIWHSNDDTGSIESISIQAHTPIVTELNHWAIAWDEGLKKKITSLRTQYLPNETGGILVGYIDQKTKNIYIVDILPAPSDSISEPTGFTRGSNELEDTLEKIAEKTTGIVTYIGEWHSHPRKASTAPSKDDIGLLGYLAKQMSDEGLPALMAIVGDNDVSFSLGTTSDI